MANKHDSLRRPPNTPPMPQESSKKRGPNKPTYKGRRLSRPASRGRRAGS
jgi:hypothetical protein